jgi:nicotinamidase/pyrazinamidase
MKALLLVDIQNDFMPGGALAVPHGDEILPAINALLKLPFDLIVATKDWHPAGHCSFADTYHTAIGEHVQLPSGDQILWPVHCVQGSWGASFASGWDYSSIDHEVHKGSDLSVDSYSAFVDNGHMRDTGLHSYLQNHHVDEIYIAGLATDYCVKFSVLDGLALGYKVYVVVDGCRAVNVSDGAGARALAEMQSAGAVLVDSSALTAR